MSHIEKLEALVKAGEEVARGDWKTHPRAWCSAVAADSDSGWSGEILAATGGAQRNFKQDEQRVQQKARCGFVIASANSRDSIAWALEVAKAAREFRDATDAADNEWDIPPSETNSHSRLYTARHALDALLAKETK